MAKSFTILFLILLLLSCRKTTEQYLNSNEPHCTLMFNGSIRHVPACGTSGFYAYYSGDTTLFAGFKCAGNGIVFYLKGSNKDGKYVLDNHNISAYDDDFYNSFSTDSLHRGILNYATVRTNGINYIKGSFEFDGYDSSTRKSCKITDGDFLLIKD